MLLWQLIKKLYYLFVKGRVIETRLFNIFDNILSLSRALLLYVAINEHKFSCIFIRTKILSTITTYYLQVKA
jgi:hypothetical protein